MKKSKVAAWLGSLAFAGTIGVTYAQQKPQTCYDALGIQAPQESFLDSAKKWAGLYDARKDSFEQGYAIMEKIENIGKNDQDKTAALYLCVTTDKDGIREAGIKALGRIGNDDAKYVLSLLIAEEHPDVAARELMKLDKNMAYDALRKSKYGRRVLEDMIIEGGGQDALKVLVSRKDTSRIADFFIKNHRKHYDPGLVSQAVRLLESNILAGYGWGNGVRIGYNCDKPIDMLYHYSLAIYAADRGYARSGLLDVAEDTKCYNHTPLSPIVNGLRGEFSKELPK